MKSLLPYTCVGIVLAVLLVLPLSPIPVEACNTGTVRDDAFTARRDQYRLCYFASPGAVQEADLVAMNQWLAKQEDRFNLSLEVVDMAQEAMFWEQYGLPEAPNELPTTLLIGATGINPRAFVLYEWKGIAGVEQVEALLNSPVLEKAKETLVEEWGVLLYSPAPDGDNTAVKDTLEAFTDRWSGEHPPGFSMLEFDRRAPEEAMLSALIGPRDDQAWTAMLFGRCKLLAPPLLGEDITQDGLDQVLSQLTAPCTCVEQSKDMGLDLPVYWEQALDDRFIALEEQAKAAGGYQEITFEDQVEELQADIPDDSKNMWYTVAVVLLVIFHIVMFAMTGVLFKWWRRIRRVKVNEE